MIGFSSKGEFNGWVAAVRADAALKAESKAKEEEARRKKGCDYYSRNKEKILDKARKRLEEKRKEENRKDLLKKFLAERDKIGRK